MVLDDFLDQIEEGQPTDEEDISYEIEILLEDVSDPRIAKLLRETNERNFSDFRSAYSHFYTGLQALGFNPAAVNYEDYDTDSLEGKEDAKEEDYEGGNKQSKLVKVLAAKRMGEKDMEEVKKEIDYARRLGQVTEKRKLEGLKRAIEKDAKKTDELGNKLLQSGFGKKGGSLDRKRAQQRYEELNREVQQQMGTANYNTAMEALQNYLTEMRESYGWTPFMTGFRPPAGTPATALSTISHTPSATGSVVDRPPIGYTYAASTAPSSVSSGFFTGEGRTRTGETLLDLAHSMRAEAKMTGAGVGPSRAVAPDPIIQELQEMSDEEFRDTTRQLVERAGFNLLQIESADLSEIGVRLLEGLLRRLMANPGREDEIAEAYGAYLDRIRESIETGEPIDLRPDEDPDDNIASEIGIAYQDPTNPGTLYLVNRGEGITQSRARVAPLPHQIENERALLEIAKRHSPPERPWDSLSKKEQELTLAAMRAMPEMYIMVRQARYGPRGIGPRGGRAAPQRQVSPQIQQDIRYVLNFLQQYPDSASPLISTGVGIIQDIRTVILASGRVRSIPIATILNEIDDMNLPNIGAIATAFMEAVRREGYA